MMQVILLIFLFLIYISNYFFHPLMFKEFLDDFNEIISLMAKFNEG